MILYYVYLIKNNVNGKTYIGQHKTDTQKPDTYMGSGIAICAAEKKYGIENFEKHILVKTTDKRQCDWYEKRLIWWQRQLGGAEYNIADGGDGGNLGEVVNKKISEANRGKHRTAETKRKLSEAKKNMSDETKLKMSLARKGKHVTEETKRKLSEARKGSNNPNFGKHFTEETKLKMSLAGKGKHHTEESKRKMSEAKKCRHWIIVNGKRHWV